MNEEAEIHAVLHRFETAIRNRDTQAAIACYAPEVIGYDLAPPLEMGPGAMRDPAGLDGWFETWDGPLEAGGPEPELKVEGTLACAWSLRRMAGHKKGAGPTELWFRSTVVLTKRQGGWKIAHVHNSVPFAMDGSGRALLDLKP